MITKINVFTLKLIFIVVLLIQIVKLNLLSHIKWLYISGLDHLYTQFLHSRMCAGLLGMFVGRVCRLFGQECAHLFGRFVLPALNKYIYIYAGCLNKRTRFWLLITASDFKIQTFTSNHSKMEVFNFLFG